MAKKAVLRAPDEEIVYTWCNLIVDSVKSHTIIEPKNNGNGNRRNSVVLCDSRQRIKQSIGKTTIFFKSGYYLQIFS
jgi:hypothetical protein